MWKRPLRILEGHVERELLAACVVIVLIAGTRRGAGVAGPTEFLVRFVTPVGLYEVIRSSIDWFGGDARRTARLGASPIAADEPPARSPPAASPAPIMNADERTDRVPVGSERDTACPCN